MGISEQQHAIFYSYVRCKPSLIREEYMIRIFFNTEHNSKYLTFPYAASQGNSRGKIFLQTLGLMMYCSKRGQRT